MAKKKIPAKYMSWVEARQRFRLSDAQIQMARELGLDPKKLGRFANTRQKLWKLLLPQCIEEPYFKRFKKSHPNSVRSVEQIVKDAQRKREVRKARKQGDGDPAHPDHPATARTSPQNDR